MARGRRSALTTDTEWAICDEIRKGHTQSAAARAAGVHPRTLSRWLEEGRKHRKGKFRRLLEAVEKARSELREVLDATEYEIAVDKSLPATVRLRAVQMIRARIWGHGHAQPLSVVDVYHHHDHQHEVTVQADAQAQDEEPPRSLVSDHDLHSLPDAALREALEGLQRARAMLPDSESTPDVIDAQDVA